MYTCTYISTDQSACQSHTRSVLSKHTYAHSCTSICIEERAHIRTRVPIFTHLCTHIDKYVLSQIQRHWITDQKQTFETHIHTQARLYVFKSAHIYEHVYVCSHVCTHMDKYLLLQIQSRWITDQKQTLESELADLEDERESLLTQVVDMYTHIHARTHVHTRARHIHTHVRETLLTRVEDGSLLTRHIHILFLYAHTHTHVCTYIYTCTCT